jgi:2-iminoacetate synthase
MFSDHHSSITQLVDSNQYKVNTNICCDEIIALQPFDPNISQLLWHSKFGIASELDDKLLERSEKIKKSLFKNKVFAISPLYATSICKENCLYCNFRTGNKGIELNRNRLSLEELSAEAHYLINKKGLRTIELVYSTDPLLSVESICEHVKLVHNILDKHGGGLVGINAEALDEKDYKRLVDVGLNFVVLWQETYGKVQYHTIHPGKTKKANFEYRLNAYERMLNAGVKNIGMGVLSGLGNWKFDWAMLMHHEAYLLKEYGVSAAILGIPRLKQAAGALVQDIKDSPSNQEFLSALAMHNIFSPSTMAFVNTREDWELCVRQAAGGGCLFTYNCSTIPGGYSLKQKGYQFPTYTYDTLIYCQKLQDHGMNTIFKWSFDDLEMSRINVTKMSVYA